MSRLIDADELKRAFNGNRYGTKAIEYVIDDVPTVDAVPVIRCKDCKYYYEKEWIVGGGSYTTCWYKTIGNAQPNDFCSRAERKEE